MQDSPTIVNISPKPEGIEEVETVDLAPERLANIWVGRITSIVGGICLTLALMLWLIRPDHYRPVLALLVVAMFAAILHSYTFDDERY
jgi:cytochrome bd-type quinol oxidase subunit 1